MPTSDLCNTPPKANTQRQGSKSPNQSTYWRSNECSWMWVSELDRSQSCRDEPNTLQSSAYNPFSRINRPEDEYRQETAQATDYDFKSPPPIESIVEANDEDWNRTCAEEMLITDGDFRATTMTGIMIRRTARRINQRFNLLRNKSLLPVDTIADTKLSNAEVLSAIVITRTIPRTQLGNCPRRRKKTILPSEGSPDHAPVQAARSPVIPTKRRMMVTTTVAIPTPIRKSRSLLEANVRNQKPETKKSFVRIATGRIYISCQPSRLGPNKPED
ncbi:MAG: hypothetical protein LQ340_004814 [Diploschistes diacapsis]|nr:MAG: hypothetical protein LQ340_004814 [Diploschistes diacapsis]